MPSYAYVARTQAGQEVAGFLIGTGLDDIVAKLHQQGLAILHVSEQRNGNRKKSWAERLGGMPFQRVSTRNLALFNRQLSTIIEAGIPIVRGLRGLATDSTSGLLSRAVSNVAARVEKGENLSDAMSNHPVVFNRMYLSMIRAGERAGTLDQIVDQLAIYLEKVDAIKTKVRAATAYPMFVLIFAFAVTLFLLLEIVPTFADIYADFNAQLPALTQWVIHASNAVKANALAFLGGGALLLLLALVALRTPSGRYMADLFLLRVPVFGAIVRKATMSRFARTFGILMRSGLPVLESLELVKGAAGNEVVARAIGQAKKNVGSGRGITESFRATDKFPEMVLQLMATGEEAGDLDTLLIKSSDFYDREVEADVHSISSLIEPLMIVIVGALIGVVVVSMFLPIFSLGDAIMKGGANY